MDLILFLALLAPVVVALVVKFVLHQSITIIEAITQAVLVCLVVSSIWAIGRYSGAGDVELWNGEVTRKQIQRESCPQYWRDYQDGFCTEYRTRTVEDGPRRQECTGSGKDKTCRWVQDYKTQYYYIYPWEQKFYIYTNVNTTFNIPRVDAQGAIVPPRYNISFVGDPVAVPKSYSNWVKAASNSIFHEDGQAEAKYKDILPAYPMEIYDTYKVNRIVKVGRVDVPSWLNDVLRAELKQLGPQRQMNVIIVAADARAIGTDFPHAVRRYWQGFKKNDAVIFVGLDGQTLKWANVMSWSKKSIFDVTLRDEILKYEGKTLDFMVVMNKLTSTAMELYERRSMKEFEHLKSQIPVPTWLTIMVLVISFGGSAGLTLLFQRVDFDPIKALSRS